jgi:formamidopyrimidine-DNA glycosylase
MPELPEVEAVVHGLLEDRIEGARIRSVVVHRASSVKPQTAAEFSASCHSRTIRSAERRAKNILLHLSGDRVIRVHLRMTGDLRIGTGEENPPFVRVEWQLSGGRILRFMDSRNLGQLQLQSEAEMAKTLRHLGIEPLSRAFTAARLADLAQTSRLPAKPFLMDQTKVAGLGNIYAAEVLFRAGVAPTRPMNTLHPDEIARLHKSIRQVLRRAVQSVYKAYRTPAGYRNHRDDFSRMVYGRSGETCQACGSLIGRIRQGGRSTYFCSTCQR